MSTLSEQAISIPGTGTYTLDPSQSTMMLLDADNHPDISFRSTELIHHDQGWTLRGRLTVRGENAPVDFAITQSRISGRGVSIPATARVDRYAHGITKGKGMAARHLDIELRAEFRPA
jgi:polyisoprenoid-binding protein YceI